MTAAAHVASRQNGVSELSQPEMDNCSGLTRTTPKYTLVKARYSNCCNCLEQTHGKRGPDTGRIQMLSPHRVLWMLYERASTNKNQRKENINSKSHKPRPSHDLSPRSQRYVGDAMWPLARTNRGGPPSNSLATEYDSHGGPPLHRTQFLT